MRLNEPLESFAHRLVRNNEVRLFLARLVELGVDIKSVSELIRMQRIIQGLDRMSEEEALNVLRHPSCYSTEFLLVAKNRIHL